MYLQRFLGRDFSNPNSDFSDWDTWREAEFEKDLPNENGCMANECGVCLYITVYDGIQRHTTVYNGIQWYTIGIQMVYGIQLVYNWYTVGIQLVYSWYTVGIQLVYNGI